VKSINFLDRLGLVLLTVLTVCVVMLGLTYQELEELEERTGKSKGNKERTIEARLEEMMRKMEKDD